MQIPLLSLLAFSATGATILTGQLTFLLVLPVTLAWLAARHDHWLIAAVWLGIVLSVKPFLLIFLPYFLLRRGVEETMVLVNTAIGCFTIGVFAFGIEAGAAWIQMLADVSWPGISMNASALGYLTRTLGEGSALIRPLWLVIAGGVAVVTMAGAVAGRERVDTDRAFALLLLAALLISPLGWIYYLLLPVGPYLACVAKWPQRRIIAVALLTAPGLLWPAGITPPWPSLYFFTVLTLWFGLVADCYTTTIARKDSSLPSSSLTRRHARVKGE